MASNMDKVWNITQSVTTTKDNSPTECQKAMGNIAGIMDLPTRVISNKDVEMDMEYGKIQNKLAKSIKVITFWIKSMAMEYMIGQMDTYIRDIS